MTKSVLITGCSSGIGLCAAETLHQRGYQVFAGVRKPADQQRLIQQGIRSVLLDVADSQSIQRAVDEALAQTQGRLDALVNNAGFGQPGAVEDLSRDTLRAQFEANVFGLQELINHVLPVMRRQDSGRIVNMSSLLGLISMPYRGAYCASKYAVEALTDALRLEAHGSGIRVSLIEPGPIESQFRRAARQHYQQHIAVEQSPHGEKYARMLDNIEQLKTESRLTLPPAAVVKKLLHALESPRPKIRYYVTLPAYVLATLKRFLPSALFDRVILKIHRMETQ
jgi:NAD(P)-dependent dehydrogenase (short-subunit alcohol dehydrogenase family)